MMLFHIYGGLVTTWLRELLVVGDMYGISGLKLTMEFVLRRDKCHFFHKPCSDCFAGVCYTLPVAFTYGLDTLFEQCLKWNNTYFERLWRCKSFAQLPEEILNRCLEGVVNEIGVLNVVLVYMDCVKIIQSLQNLKWAEGTVVMATKVIDSCVSYVSKNAMSVLRQRLHCIEINYQGMGEESIDLLFQRALSLQSPEVGVETYSGLLEMCAKIERALEGCPWSSKFPMILAHAKRYMITNIGEVVGLSAWIDRLTKSQQEELMKEAGYVSVGNQTLPRLRKPKLSVKKGLNLAPASKKFKTKDNSSHKGYGGAKPKCKTSNSAKGSTSSHVLRNPSKIPDGSDKIPVESRSINANSRSHEEICSDSILKGYVDNDSVGRNVDNDTRQHDLYLCEDGFIHGRHGNLLEGGEVVSPVQFRVDFVRELVFV